jgi:glycogen debranching enzyme
LGTTIEGPVVVLGYEGLDQVLRRTRLRFDPLPEAILSTEAFFRAALPPHGEATFDIVVYCEAESSHSKPAAGDSSPEFERRPSLTSISRPVMATYEVARSKAAAEVAAARRETCVVTSSDPQFNEWINRAVADLRMMTTRMATGPYPYAGVPWFSTPFGRDGLLTALECLWIDPDLARGVLAFLADTQATELDPAQDAEPGKILHEARGGEMPALGEVPFGRYYGSVDATPLFIWLAGAYFERTGDREFVESIRPHVERALDWIDNYGDRDGDGFVEYWRNSPQGLSNQGWKDSHDSVFHAEGALAAGPIALCEVQAYVYAARRAAAQMAHAFGDSRRADHLRQEAARLKKRFSQSYWCETLGTFALALDGDKRPCRVRTSNAGHCLWAEIADLDWAQRCGELLMSDSMFTGWGIRTVARGEARYNPMSYHNGSVWPHDTALAAAGLAKYGMSGEALRIFSALYDVSKWVDLNRLPELFCGFERRPGEGPTRYPVACAPQAWSAAAVFQLLQACLGLEVLADQPIVRFTSPQLPSFLREVRIENLRVGAGTVDLLLHNRDHDVGVDVLRRDANIQVHISK